MSGAADYGRTRKAVFVSHRHSVEGASGGQQVCTREYRETLRLAGFELHDVYWEHERTLGRRVANKLSPSPYRRPWHRGLADEVRRAARFCGTDLVLLNVIDLLPLAEDLKLGPDGSLNIVMLSHGLASVDEVHTQRIARHYPALPLNPSPFDPGRLVGEEAGYLPYCDHVVSLAPFEVEICRWLGARANSWLPRAVPGAALRRTPIRGRVGTVGTLDHPPTLEAIWLALSEIERQGPGETRVRVASSSKRQGEFFAERFPFVDFVGRLDDSSLEAEAATWSAFLHPMFCFARGASTKLATGLSWGLPCITTSSGMRGYQLPEGSVVLADSVSDFARETIRAATAPPSDRERPTFWSIEDSALRLRGALDTLRGEPAGGPAA